MPTCITYIKICKYQIASLLMLIVLFLPSCGDNNKISIDDYKGTLNLTYSSVIIDNNIVSLHTKAVAIPNINEFTLLLENSSNNVIYSGEPLTTDLILETGSYTADLFYGENYLDGELLYSNNPFYSCQKNFDINTGNKTTLSLTPKFSGSVLLFNISDDLLKHYTSYEIKLEGTIGGNTFSKILTKSTQLFIRPGASVNVNLNGVNSVGENKSSLLFSSASLTNGVLADATEYVVNVNDNSPIITLPSQFGYNSWASFHIKYHYNNLYFY